MSATSDILTASRRIAKRLRSPRRLRIGREAAFLAAGRLTPYVAVDSDGGRYLLSTSDRGQGRLTFMYGNRDVADIRRALRAICGHEGLLHDHIFIDIGANIGTSTVPALTTFGAAGALAFEPEPENYRLLTLNLLGNGVLDRARTFPLALSDQEGELSLTLSDFNSGDHRVAAGHMPPPGREHIAVLARRFDDLVNSGEIDLERTALVWIDVQGHEAHVLEGAHRLLESSIPVHLEFWPDGLRDAGGLDRLLTVVAEHYRTFIDVGTAFEVGSNEHRSTRDLPALARRYPGERYTNLVLMA